MSIKILTFDNVKGIRASYANYEANGCGYDLELLIVSH